MFATVSAMSPSSYAANVRGGRGGSYPAVIAPVVNWNTSKAKKRSHQAAGDGVSGRLSIVATANFLDRRKSSSFVLGRQNS